MADDTAPAAALGRGDLLDGRFELLEAIGRGASGQVFAALDRTTGQRVALKLVGVQPGQPGGAARGLGQEAAVLAWLDHPNVVALHAAGLLPDGRAYLAMPQLDGHTLAQWLRRTPLTPAQLGPIVASVASALDAAHARGVVHGDVCPANVFLEDVDGRVKLLDFGVARWLGENASPGDPPALPSADIRALAGLCLEALTGLRDASAVRRHPRLSPALTAVLAPALDVGSRGSFRSASELAEAFYHAAGLQWPPPDHVARGADPSGARDTFSGGRGSGLPAEPPSWMPDEPLRLSSVPPPPPAEAPALAGRVLLWLAAALCALLALALWWLP